MERNVLNRAADYNKKRRKKVRRYKMFTVLAAVVVFCTTYSLIMPAITMETPQCGMEEHIHGDGCYEKTLICTQDENTEGHTHGDECYTVTTERELTCGKEECEAVEGHTHSDSCYTVTEVPQYETKTVEHTEEVTEEVGTDEDGNPITETRTVTTTEEVREQVGVEEVRELTCGYEEREAVEGHTHDDSCYTEVEHKELTCTEPETGHVHGEECYEKKLICELPEHTHDDSCYPEKDGDSEDVPPVDGEDVPPVDGEEGEEVPPAEGEEGEEVPPADSTETMKPVRVDEEGYILDENNNRVLDENGNPIKAEDVAPVEKPEEEQPEEVLPPEEQVGSAKVDADGYLLDENGERVLDENGNPILVEILDEEVPTGLMMTVLPAGAEIPENYTEHYSYADPEGEYAVTVHAPEGAVPADAELCATVMWGASTETEDGGVVPMDIHFEVEGHEIEPAMPVYVVINVEGLIPEDADHDSIEIHHYKGDEYNAEDAVAITAQAAGLVTDSEPMMMSLAEDEPETAELPENVEVVANSEDNTGIVAVDAIADTTEMKAAFEVDSFSTFTITYYYNWGSSSKELKVYVVDEYGNELNKGSNISNGSWPWYDTDKNEWTVNEIKSDAGLGNEFTINNTTYTFVGARADDAKEGITVTSVSCLKNKRGSYKWYYNNNKSLDKLYLVYKGGESPKTERKAYFYVLDPENNNTFTWDTHAFDSFNGWSYAGRGYVNREDVSKLPNSTNYKFNADDVIEYPTLPDTYKDGNTTYYLEGSDAAKTAGDTVNTYRVEWARFKTARDHNNKEPFGGDSNAAAKVENGEYKDNPTWHVDGILVFGTKITVNYYILDVDGNPIPGIGDATGKVAFELTDAKGSLKGIPNDSVVANYDSNEYEEYTKGGENLISNSGKITKWFTENNTEWNFKTDRVGESGFNLYAYLKPIAPDPTFNLDLFKVVGNETKNPETGEVTIEATEVPLGDASFLLTDGNEYSREATTQNAEGGSVDVGHVTFTDLKPGTYTLTEKIAPAGYNLLADSITFTINADGTISENSAYAWATEADSNNTILLKVANIGGYVLPSTGGEGTYWYTWSGAMLLMMAAAYTLMYRKSYRRREGLED